MTVRAISYAALLLLAPFLAQAEVTKPAGLSEIAELEQCLADPAKTQAVFFERYPHETCIIGQTCDPKLVQSSETLAKQRCRVVAVESCGGVAECLAALDKRWTERAVVLSAELERRWVEADQTSLSKLAQRRLSKPEAFTLDGSCPDSIGGTPLPCAPARALANLTRMEKLDAYLTAEEARP